MSERRVCEGGVLVSVLRARVLGLCVSTKPLTAAKLEWTSMGIHGEVFQVHGAFCSDCEPAESHTGMDSTSGK